MNFCLMSDKIPANTSLNITKAMVTEKLSTLARNRDLSEYIL